MRSTPVSASPSASIFNFACFSTNLPVYFSEMEDTKRRATIRNQAAKRKETDEGAMGTDSSRPSAKKRLLLKGDHDSKK